MIKDLKGKVYFSSRLCLAVIICLPTIVEQLQTGVDGLCVVVSGQSGFI